MFHQILPDEEFCPPAPNPEDIIYDGEGPQAKGAGFDQTNNTEADKNQAEEESAAVETDSSDPAEKIDSVAQETPLDSAQTPPSEE